MVTFLFDKSKLLETVSVDILKQSDKSFISLRFHEKTQVYYVEKILDCPIEPYLKIQQITSAFLPKIYLVEEREGKTYVIEEYIKGRSLEEMKPTKYQENLWMKEIFHAVSLLHQENLLHRDIKPSNILLGEDGHIRLIDFDAMREESEEKESDTRLLGTQGFAPPEQYGFSSTDVRADIYALGVTMKKILGNRPSQRKIIQKCTNFNPKKRYASMKQLKTAWQWRHVLFLYGFLAPILAIQLSFFLIASSLEEEYVSDSGYIHPLSTLAATSYYASNEDDDSKFLNNSEDDFQGIHLEFQQIRDDYYATLYYTKQGEGWASLCYYQGDSLLPVAILEEDTYEIPFDQRGKGRLQEDYDTTSVIEFTVNPLGEVFFTLEEEASRSINHMSLKPPDIWRDGEFLFYVMEDSPYEDPLDGKNEVHPFQIIKTFGQSIYQNWRNDTEVRKISSGDIHLLSCKPSIFTGITFTYYEKDDLNTIHTARSPHFINEIYLDDVYFVKFSDYQE